MKFLTPLLCLLFAQGIAIAQEPAELVERRQAWETQSIEAQTKVDKLYFNELEELKKNFVQAGNLPAARAVDNAIKGEVKADNEPDALVKLSEARSKSLKKALKPLDKQYWQDLKKLRGDFQKQGSLAGIEATDAEIKKVLAAYKKPEPPKKKADVAKDEPKEKQDDDPKEDNNPEAATILEKAKGKDAQFQYDLAQRYFKGDGVEKDEKIGVQLLHLAAEQGHSYAAERLANCYSSGSGVRKNEKKTFEWLSVATEKGHPMAPDALAVFYRDGKVVRQDWAKAAELYEKSSPHWSHASAAIGGLYAQGHKTLPKNQDKAAEWYYKAAMQGHTWSWDTLRGLYGKDNKDIQKGAVWLRKGADAGNALAQYALGKLYRDGDGVTKDKEKAAEWFGKAADQGHKEAKMDLELLK